MKYFLIGIKGSGMASLAQLLADLGHEVMGSDIEYHIFTQDILNKRGIKIYPFNKDNIKEDMIIVKGNTYNEDHEEVKQARALNLKVYTYPQMVSKLIDKYFSICVAGTHGKTTTTGLITKLLQNKEATSFLIGNGHAHIVNDSNNLIVESCEYKDNYLNYKPDIALINNIDLDHVDYFKSLDQYIKSFETFALQAKKYVLLNGSDDNVKKIKKQDNFYYFGLSDDCNFQAKNIVFDEDGLSFDFYTDFNEHKRKEFTYHFQLNVYGKHMLYNILAAIGLYLLKGIDYDYKYIEKQLNSFEGVERRFQETFVDTNIFIDDYAHHPTAIKLTIEAVRQKYPDKKVVALFKPDRYSRILEFGNEFGLALDLADEAYLFEFPENAIKEQNIDIDASYLKELMKNGDIIGESLEDALRFKDYDNTVFLSMSTKNVYDFANMIISVIKH